MLRLLTRDHGRQTFMARGVRKNGKDGRRASLAGLHTVHIEGMARSRTAMPLLTRAEIIKARHRLPHLAPALAASQVLKETINRLVPEADPCTEVFELTESLLDHLENETHPLLFLSLCLSRIIHLLGYGWQLENCAACGGHGDPAFFSVKRQWAVCAPCGTPHAQRLLPLTPEVHLAMQRLDWPPHPACLSAHGAGLLYRITVNCLAQMSGGILLTDGPFRAMMGLAYGQVSILNSKETPNDRQGSFRDFGLSPMQRGVGLGHEKRGVGLSG